MAKQRRSTVQSSYLPIGLLILTVVVMLGMSGAAAAWMLGVFDQTPAAKPVDHTGQLAFPAIVRPMGAYEALTKDDFIDLRTKQLNVVWLPEATAKMASRNMSELIGRVLRRDKQAGAVLSEADFLEKGTRPGLVAGIPAGKLALAIPATGVPGLEQLRGGDRFDLLVSLPMREDANQLANSEPAALFGGIKPPSLRVGQLSRRHGVKHLVTDGMLVSLFRGEKRSTNGPSGLTTAPSSNKSRSSAPAPALFAELAVDPEEVGPLTEAISLGTKLTCVLRSGLPNGQTGDVLSTDGLVPVITTAAPVNAFSALTDENLMDEATGQLHFYYFPPDKVSPEWISDPAQLYGRVVGRPLRRGSLISESDLLPIGTRPGISAGLPVGMAGMSLSKTNVQGFEKLAVGDSFSILTRVPGEVTAATPVTSWARLRGGQLSDEDARLAEMVRTGIREVVRDAIYLSESAGDTVIIGIPELEVAKLAQLIRDQVEVFAVARSSQNQSDSPSPSKSASGTPIPPNATRQTPRPASSPAPRAAIFNAGRSPSEIGPAKRSVGSIRFIHQVGVDDAAPPMPGVGKNPGTGSRIPVPILSREVLAYKRLSIEDFVDPATGRVQMFLFDPAAVGADWELDIHELIDRVVVRSLEVGRPVRTTDLAPAGAIAGPALGLESGMRGVTVNADQIVGLDSLTVGTVFDLVAARGVEVSSLADRVRQSIASSDAVREATKLPGGRVAASRTIATRVRLLTNLGVIRIVAPKPGGVTEKQTQTQLTADGSTITETVKSAPITYEERAVSQYVLAVPEEFVGSVLGLLDSQDPLFVSLRPVSEEASLSGERTPHGPLAPPVRAVIQEHVRGAELDKEVFLTDRLEPVALLGEGVPPATSPNEGP